MTRHRRAMAGFGQALMSFGMRMGDKAIDQLVHSEFIKGKALWEQRNNEFADSLVEDTDYLSYPEKYKKYTEQAQEEILADIKTPRAQNALKNYFISEGPGNERILSGIMGEKLREEEIRNLSGAIETFIPGAGADPDVLIQGIANAEAAAQGAFIKGYISADEAEENIIFALMEDWPEVALKQIDASSLTAKRKIQLRTATKYASAKLNQALEIQREKDRDEISKAIRSGIDVTPLIEGSSLDESEQWTWSERARAEADRLDKGKEIITDNGVRTELYNDIMGILTLTKTKKEVLEKAKAARFDPQKPTLDETDYSKIETAIHAQYEQAYGQGMSKVSKNAEGLLLNPDSLGYIKNAPIRYKILGDFNEAWLKWIAEKGDTLKISEIYPEGRRMAATFQISDEEAERQEVEMNERLREREATVYPKMPTDKKILEAAKKVAGEQTTLPQPKTKEEYDKLKSGTKYIDPDGIERTKK
jgi:hypothetical protein